MQRLFAALLAVAILSAAGARAQDAGSAGGQAEPAQKSPRTPGSLAPVLSAPTGSAEVDPAVRDLVRREVDKAKEEMRDEVRAEVQSEQSARQFLEAPAGGERPKLDFFQLNGYLRLRYDFFDNMDLHRGADPSGWFLFPRPLRDADNRGSLTSGNMRFRAEPTINVSEQVRVLAQIDALDNLVLGSTPGGLFARTDSVLFPFDARGQVPPSDGVNADTNSIVVKRVWGEVQTPVGMLSFGRMPSSWGLGILANPGNGIDDDLGDSVDRVQFALSPLSTPLGKLVLVPMVDFVVTEVTSQDAKVSRGLGQPFDRDPEADAMAFGLKIVREDTEDEMKRRWDRDEASASFGVWYMYKAQNYDFPQFVSQPAIPSTGAANSASDAAAVGNAVHRDAYAHTVDLWGRYQTKRLRLEGEFVGIIGQIGNSAGLSPAEGSVLLRQFGGVAQADYKLLGGKLVVGGEFGVASGSRDPGFGNEPGRYCTPSGSGSTAQTTCLPTQAGDINGLKFRATDKVLALRNFTFNPAYRMDLILWRQIIQGVTGAFYLKPNVRYDIIGGLDVHASIIYSQSIFPDSTPSVTNSPLGVEFDLGLSYKSDDGFIAFIDYGLLQPLSGFNYEPGRIATEPPITRANCIHSGIAIKF
ncbi:MAG TPA: TIGR04551 family protein [Anaeromyxobacteraceae bacterium]|nr:TIGR04551 family protein [Anaeromyxobacteraceae bacterium]